MQLKQERKQICTIKVQNNESVNHVEVIQDEPLKKKYTYKNEDF